MERRAIISVKSYSEADPDEAIEVVTPGKFIIEDNEYKAVYEESEISGMAGTTTTLKVTKDSMNIERVGSTTASMFFKKGECEVTLYNTPYGALDLNVDTRELNIEITENGGEIYSKYILGFEGQEGIMTEINIKIKLN